MDSHREGSGLLSTIGRAALIWALGGAIYGVVEALVNNAAGLYLPLRLWFFAVAVYTVLGAIGGVAAGMGLAVARPVVRRLGLATTPLLMASFFGVAILGFVGIPINDRLLPGVLAPKSLVVNAILLALCSGIAAVCYAVLRAEPPLRRTLTYVALAFCVSVCLAVGYYIDGYVPALAATGRRAIAYAALVVACAGLFLAVRRVLRGSRAGASAGAAAAAWLAWMALAGPVPGHAGEAGGAAAPRPNVLWVVMDTTRADHIGAYGYPRAVSPNIDAIAQDGALFENAIAQSSWTMPTHFQMVTSRVAAGTRKVLEPEFETAAEIFAANGYETAAVLANFSIGRQSGFGQGFDTFIDGPAMIFYLYAFDNVPVVKALLKTGLFEPAPLLRMFDIMIFREAEAVRAETITDHAIDVLEDRSAEKPFFLFLNYMDPHDSYDPPEPYRSEFAPGADPMAGFQRWDPEKLKSISSNEFIRDVMPGLDEKAWHDMLNLYDAEIAYMDAHIGRLVASLKERGLYDDTIVVVTADHGELFGEHGLANHFKGLTEEEIHVPLVIRYPKLVRPERVKTTVQSADILPTLLDMLSIRSDQPNDGKSLLALLRGDSGGEAGHGEAYSYLIRRPDKKFPHTAPGHLFSIHRGGEKLVWSSTGKHEYYDLPADAQGHNNLYGSRPEAADAEAKLTRWRDANGLSSVDSYENEKLDPTTRDRLKSLGYVQ